MTADQVPEATNDINTPAAPIPRIKYAVIGYGAAGGQFIADLALQRLIFNLVNEKKFGRPHVEYNLEVTVYSSMGEEDDGAGDAWSSEHDGCINSPIPGHWRPKNLQLPGSEYLTSDHDRFVQLVTGLDVETGRAAMKNFTELRSRLEKVNQPGAALLLARRDGNKFFTDLPCVPRSLLGEIRAKSLQAIVEYANDHIDGLIIRVEHKTRAVIESVKDPRKPRVKVYGVKKIHTVEFDKVISFSGARREVALQNKIQELPVYVGLPSSGLVEQYLKDRKCDGPTRKTIAFAGAQLSFIDNITLVATLRGAFDFCESEGAKEAHCTAKPPPPQDQANDFVVFTKRSVGSVKPRLSYGMDWPGEHAGPTSPVSYLETEHLLALRTQKGYEWLTVVQTIWKSMIAYRMKKHPDEYPNYKTMNEEWSGYSEECKRYRQGKPTVCGLERTLIYALSHGYGAESSVEDAKTRMQQRFSAIFVCGQRMNTARCAHVSSVSCIQEFGPNKEALGILEDWYRTFSSSPVDICEPVFDLASHGVMRHQIADGSVANLNEEGDKIMVGDEETQVDAFFPLILFSKGLDDVLKSIVDHGELKTQAEGSKVPVWRANGQLVDKHDKLVNVWDYGNNRGSDLPLFEERDKAFIKPRTAVHALAACHDFAPPLAACLLAHDIYSIRGEEDPSSKLEEAIAGKQPDRRDFEAQMWDLEQFYYESMERYKYVQAIQAECLRGDWRDYFRRGVTKEDRARVMEELSKSQDKPKRRVADAYYAQLHTITDRKAMGYDEWHGAFADQDLPVAWDILWDANADRREGSAPNMYNGQ